jgi:hypothetical protein
MRRRSAAGLGGTHQLPQLPAGRNRPAIHLRIDAVNLEGLPESQGFATCPNHQHAAFSPPVAELSCKIPVHVLNHYTTR